MLWKYRPDSSSPRLGQHTWASAPRQRCSAEAARGRAERRHRHGDGASSAHRRVDEPVRRGGAFLAPALRGLLHWRPATERKVLVLRAERVCERTESRCAVWRASRVAMLRHAWRRSHRRGTRRCWAWPLPPRPPRPRRSPARVRAAARPCWVLCAACCVRSRALLSSTLGTNRRSSLHFSLALALQLDLAGFSASRAAQREMMLERRACAG
jgi:hypothetical protein